MILRDKLQKFMEDAVVYEYIEAPKSEYLSIVRRYSQDRVYLLFCECKREDYNGDVGHKVYGDEYALVACRFCHKKQKQFCPDSNESYCGVHTFAANFAKDLMIQITNIMCRERFTNILD